MSYPPDPAPMRAWAVRHNALFLAKPEPSWFEAWEPFDTMIAPSHYVNSVVAKTPAGQFVYVEPWTADEGMEPVDRTLLAFATHDGLRVRASARVGEWFLTRVAYVGTAPPNRVPLGDGVWDRDVATFAPMPAQAQAAFHPRVRALLESWRFRGHIEMRVGGMVVHVAGLRPMPADLSRLADFVPKLLASALAYPTT